MPTFFRKDQLTSKQQANWDAAVAIYESVQKNNLDVFMADLDDATRAIYTSGGVPMNDDQIRERTKMNMQIMSGGFDSGKSALFSRILNGAKPLRFAPPTAMSYPWYQVIESSEPVRAHMVEFATTGNGDRYVMISQSPWRIVASNPDGSHILTVGRWDTVGMRWKLAQVAKPILEFGPYLACHYDPQIQHISTLEQLSNNERWLQEQRNVVLAAAQDDAAAADYVARKVQKYSQFGEAVAQRELTEARTTVQERLQAGLPALLTDEEIAQQAARVVDQWFEDGISVGADGSLLSTSWLLTREPPVVADGDLYLDLPNTLTPVAQP